MCEKEQIQQETEKHMTEPKEHDSAERIRMKERADEMIEEVESDLRVLERSDNVVRWALLEMDRYEMWKRFGYETRDEWLMKEINLRRPELNERLRQSEFLDSDDDRTVCEVFPNAKCGVDPRGKEYAKTAFSAFLESEGTAALDPLARTHIAEIDTYRLYEYCGYDSRHEWFVEELGDEWATAIQKVCPPEGRETA